jgi:sulfite exporter TauE/SafE
MGIIGSFHCIGMCGPLAMSLPIKDDSWFSKFTGALLYNSGRIVTYSFFGFLFGLAGKSFILFGFQPFLSIILGTLIILYIIVSKLFPANFNSIKGPARLFEKIRLSVGSLFFLKNNHSLFAIGLLNGLLPCGLVYMAIAAAVSFGTISSSVLFMAAFGAGTLPVMWSIIFLGNFITIQARQKIRSAYPYLAMLMACLLIIRGMGLGIAYISPAYHVENKPSIICCPKPE